jgi:small redox-active disulfide protein 2
MTIHTNMKHIKILGTGCAKCKHMEAIVNQVVTQLGIDATVEKVEDIQKIMEYNVLTTPVLVIDEQIKVKGRVPLAEEVKTLLQ